MLSIVVCLIASRVVLRSKSKLRYFLDALAFLPHAVPSIVFAVSGLLLSLFVFRNIFSCRSTAR
jgi:ABC-type Fe3+ transport system permease subunit